MNKLIKQYALTEVPLLLLATASGAAGLIAISVSDGQITFVLLAAILVAVSEIIFLPNIMTFIQHSVTEDQKSHVVRDIAAITTCVHGGIGIMAGVALASISQSFQILIIIVTVCGILPLWSGHKIALKYLQ